MSELPLQGIRVVEVGTAIAAPALTRILADFGAEVIKVDLVNFWPSLVRGALARPSKEFLAKQVALSGGYPNKEPGPHPWNVYPVFMGQARNKLSMTVRDLREPRSRDIFLRLIKASDVFVENNQPETLDKLQIGYDVLRQVKPDIIVVRLSACGYSGPYSAFRTHGTQLDALGGHTSIRGYADTGREGVPDLPFTDYLAATHTALAVMAALLYRHRTGKGQLIKCAQLETLPLCLGEAIMDYVMNQRVHTRIGNRDIHGAAPCGCYRCLGKDDWLSVTVTSEEEWQGLKRALGNPPWAEDERFSDGYARWQNQDEMDKLVEAWTVRHEKNDAMRLLQKEGVAAGPVLNAADTYSDPHLNARGFFEKVTHEDVGERFHPGMGWKLSRTPLSIRRPPVRFGEHNEYVYKKILKVSDEEYAALEKEGEISSEPSPDIP